jgi:hypothetical protein
LARLAVRRLVYRGQNYAFESPGLSDGLVVIEGDNGTGKSTFSDLIFFGLGGTVPQFDKAKKIRHVEVTSDSNASVTLGIEINGIEYTLRRSLDGDREILVTAPDGDVQVLPINRGPVARRVFSDWLLEKLQIPVVTLHSGAYAGKLNIADLMRLIYHDQDADPSAIFKKLPADSFVTDSREFRRAIFEILTGRASQEYYSALAELREAEKVLAESSARLRQFKDVAATAAEGEDLNVVFLAKRIEEAEARLGRLQAHRDTLRTREIPPDVGDDSEMIRRQLAEAQLELLALDRNRFVLDEEMTRLTELRQDVVTDLGRIKKIIHSHQTLRLFTPDSCPCCLRIVERSVGKCICGGDVDEKAFERFAYSTDEYVTMLKSRDKNLETISAAFEACLKERKGLDTKRTTLLRQTQRLRERLAQWVRSARHEIGTLDRDQVDDEMVELRVEIERLHHRMGIERERDALEMKVGRLKEQTKELSRKVVGLDVQAQEDAATKVMKFNELYNTLMRATDPGCRDARLDANYMPSINDGEYREASSRVARRLMYFLALFTLSIQRDDVPFPRFMLIDTPETAGIDVEHLRVAIRKVFETVSSARVPCQVILTTGVGKYPAEAAPRVALVLSKKEKLLRPVVTDAVEAEPTEPSPES